MSENRVQFNAIVSNQLPLYVKEDFPLISEFLEQYYLGQEYQGGPVDLIQNIDKYIKLDETTNLSESVVLNGDLDFDETTIQVEIINQLLKLKQLPHQMILSDYRIFICN